MELNKTGSTTQKTSLGSNPTAEIKQLFSNYEAALIKKDLDKLMNFYSPDVVAFDLVPPLVFHGIKSYRKSWEEAFESCAGDTQMKSEVKDLHITADETIAFAHALIHNSTTPKKGEKMDFWMRCTRCFKKEGGRWLITHEQYSVPVDFKTGKGIMNLAPDSKLH